MQERVRELELKYTKYRIKKVLKWTFLCALFGILALSFFFALRYYKTQEKLNLKALEEKKVLEEKINQAKISLQKYEISQSKIEKDFEILKQEQEKEQEKNRILIASNIFNVSVLKKSFQEKPSYEKAVLISKLYLEQKDYNKSIFWSLKANEINANLKPSWELFSQAKQALGDGNTAQKVLELYAKHYQAIELE